MPNTRTSDRQAFKRRDGARNKIVTDEEGWLEYASAHNPFTSQSPILHICSFSFYYRPAVSAGLWSSIISIHHFPLTSGATGKWQNMNFSWMFCSHDKKKGKKNIFHSSVAENPYSVSGIHAKCCWFISAHMNNCAVHSKHNKKPGNYEVSLLQYKCWIHKHHFPKKSWKVFLKCNSKM